MAAPQGRYDDADTPNEKLKDLPKWADRYARNRTVPAMLMMILFFIGFAIFALLGNSVRAAFEAGEQALGIVLSVVLVAAVIGWIWAVFGGAISQLIDQMTKDYYKKEGTVVAAKSGEKPRLSWRSWIVFGAIITAPIVAGLLPLEIQYAQPIAALYLVPLIVWHAATDFRFALPMFLLWPVLYALHAVAMVLGAPLVINGDAGHTVMWPLLGYAFIAILVAHIYSRYALKRMREISHDIADEEGA